MIEVVQAVPVANALHQATFDLNAEAVQQMLLQPIDVNAKDQHGHTALSIACQKSLDPRAQVIVRLLIEAGANPFIANNWGWNALHEAVSVNHKATALYVMQHAARMQTRCIISDMSVCDRILQLGDFTFTFEPTLSGMMGMINFTDSITVSKRGFSARVDWRLCDIGTAGNRPLPQYGSQTLLLQMRPMSDADINMHRQRAQIRIINRRRLESLLPHVSLPMPLTPQVVSDRLSLIRANERLVAPAVGVLSMSLIDHTKQLQQWLRLPFESLGDAFDLLLEQQLSDADLIARFLALVPQSLTVPKSLQGLQASLSSSLLYPTERIFDLTLPVSSVCCSLGCQISALAIAARVFILLHYLLQ